VPDATLTIISRNYGAWSLRGWLLCRFAGLDVEVEKLSVDDASARAELLLLSPSVLTPRLQHGDVAVWDTLAIAEYLAERFPDKQLWPKDVKARARARSVCAEMHSGFGALRNHCPMNIEASLPDIGRLIWRDKADVRADVSRLCGLWSELLAAQPAGGLLFGDFTIADAYFAPVCMRINTYGLPVPADLAAYVARVSALPGVKAWIADALAEHDFIDFDEPYRLGR
jgi:glutathione S-transferase